MPKVSVLTPVYNTNPVHLRECIDSILGQTFSDFEFLILNDSPDNKDIEKIVQDYARKDERVKYFSNSKNIGISASRNKLLKMAKGEYIAVFDHDDVSLPDRLQLEVEFLDKNPSYGVVSGWIHLFQDKDKIWKNPEQDLDIKLRLTENCCVFHTAAMLRKSVLDENNIQYEEFYSPAEDYRLWARLMEFTCFHNIQKVLVNYRCFEYNTSKTQSDKMLLATNYIKMEIENKFPAYRKAFLHSDHSGITTFRIRLFGKIPLLKIKNNWVYLFEFLPILKIRRK